MYQNHSIRYSIYLIDETSLCMHFLLLSSAIFIKIRIYENITIIK